MRREIWFLRWGMGYMPIHWKGVVLTAAAAFFTLAVTASVVTILHWAGHRGWGELVFFGTLIGTLMILLPVARRHS